MILLIDNYDSFTYNLYQYIGEIYENIKVFRNDKISLDEIERLNPEGIILSPGPGIPENAGICIEVVKKFGGKIPILGICLGHQAIGCAYGGKVVRANNIMHGKTSEIGIVPNKLFKNLENSINVMRYHSLIIEKNTLPEELEVTAESLDDREIMAVKHKEHEVYGLQFHPESILTEKGKQIIKNFLGGFVMLQQTIERIICKSNLEESEAYEAMNEIMQGNAEDSQIGAFLAALRMKGETAEEITGFARAMRDNAENLKLESEYVIDTCGTGGDGGRTFNISTAVSFVVAAAGVKVAKHGNRAVSSKSGSADVLEKLGFNINLEPKYASNCIDKNGMAFLFAQKYHRAMKNVAGPRKQLGIRTVFNLLGPLTNPAFVKGQVLGVYDKNLTHTAAKVLSNLGCERAMVVCGEDGLDEITTTSNTYVSELKDGKISDYKINPEDFEINVCSMDAIKGYTAEENAALIRKIFQGEKGARRDIVVLNSAAALYVGKACESMEEGVKMAEGIIDSKKAYEKMNELIKCSNNF